MKLLILCLGIAANAFASVLIKLAVTPPRRMPTLDDPLAALGNWPLLVGLVLYGMAFVFYTMALSRLPLNVAHPTLTAGAIATVAVLSVVLFKEPMPWTTATGIALVLAGVILITIRA